MIDDLDETIKQILVEELPVKNGEIDIKFDQPTREWSARLSAPTINLFLYDVRENPTLRQHGWQQLHTNGGSQDGLSHMKRMPFRVDCMYMLTTWVSGHPDDEHRLLSRCMMALFRFAVLPNDRLVGTLRNPLFEIQTMLARHDRLTNPAEVWSSLDNEMRPSIPFTVTMAFDPWTEVAGPLVKSLTLRTGQAESLPRYRKLKEGLAPSELHFIAGTVKAGGKDGEMLSGVDIALKDTGLETSTNEDGQFSFAGLDGGDYTLIATPEKGKKKEKNVSVPPKSAHEYDMEI